MGNCEAICTVTGTRHTREACPQVASEEHTREACPQVHVFMGRTVSSSIWLPSIPPLTRSS